MMIVNELPVWLASFSGHGIGIQIAFCRLRISIACMDWRQFTWWMTVGQFLLLLASNISGLLTPGHCSCQGRRQHWGWEVLRSPAHTSGTVCQLPFEPQRSRLWRSLDISRPTCLTGTDSTSEDYLGRVLQICASSSSSSPSIDCALVAIDGAIDTCVYRSISKWFADSTSVPGCVDRQTTASGADVSSVCVCETIVDAGTTDGLSRVAGITGTHQQHSLCESNHYRLRSRGDNTFGSVCVCPSICLWALSCFNRLIFDLDFWHEGRPWPWLPWDCRSRS